MTGLAAFLLAAMLLAGCKSAGYVKSDKTSRNLREAATATRAESRDLGQTMAALNQLVDSTSGDLGQQFQRFSRALDELGTSKKRADGASGRSARQSAAYFEAWGKELPAISDEALRKESMARKAEATTQYQTTSHQHQEAQKALAALVSHLKDIRKALSADLTAAGLQSVKPTARNASDTAGNVQTQLAQSASDLDALAVKMSSLIGQSPK